VRLIHAMAAPKSANTDETSVIINDTVNRNTQHMEILLP